MNRTEERGFSHIEETANEALKSKHSATSLQYLNDPFIDRLLADIPVKRKQPMINRGYYARVVCVRSIIDQFIYNMIGCGSSYQIVNLGCGFDTLCYNLLSSYRENIQQMSIYEIDFPAIIERKVNFSLTLDPTLFTGSRCSVDRSNFKNNASRESFRIDGGYSIGSQVKYLPLDLRESKKLVKLLLCAGFLPDVPTLVISECVFAYMEKRHTVDLVSQIAGFIENVAWISYDMFNPNDAFGKVMVKNLRSAGHAVPGLTEYPTLESQRHRFCPHQILLPRSTGLSDTGDTSAAPCLDGSTSTASAAPCLDGGSSTATNVSAVPTASAFEWCDSITMLEAYHRMISSDEKDRIAKLEMMDEVEEFQLIMNHYCLTLATKGKVSLDFDSSCFTKKE